MEKKKSKMKCPKCGAEMNLHAEKLSYEEGPIDPDLGGVLEEAHTCPRCGWTEVRIVT